MNLTNFLFHAHSGWRHIVILVLVLALVKLLIGLVAKQRWSRLDHRLGVTTPIVITVQWLLIWRDPSRKRNQSQRRL